MSSTIPIFPLGSPLFPGMVLPLHIFEPRYRELVRDLLVAAEGGAPALFGVVAIRQGQEVGDGAATELADIGCAAEVRAVGVLPDGRYELITVGTQRFRLDRVVADGKPYLRAAVEWVGELPGEGADERSVAVRQRFADYRRQLPVSEPEPPLPDDATVLSYAIGAAMNLPIADRQRVLAATDTGARLRLLLQLLERELAVLERLHAVPATDVWRRIAQSPN